MFESCEFNEGRWGTLMHYHLDALLCQGIDVLRRFDVSGRGKSVCSRRKGPFRDQGSVQLKDYIRTFKWR